MARAGPVQDDGGGISSELCDDCRHLDPAPFCLSAIPVQLCVDESTLNKPIREWGDFLDAVLSRICAARNTSKNGRPLWALLIHIKNASPTESYNNSFSEKISDKLKPMLMDRDFAENFYVKMIPCKRTRLWFLQVSIFGDFDGLVSRDFRSPQPLDHGLLGTSLGCIEYYLFCRTAVPNCMFQPPQGLKDKCDGDNIPVQECESIQFKSLKLGNIQSLKKTRLGQQQELFHPRSSQDYVDWLWTKQTQPLGKYISAFAKIRTGGAFYCGVKEYKGKNIIEALELPDEWKHEIEETLQEKIKEDMLWVQRDPENDQGYSVLEPDDIKKGQYFDVEFIPVKDPEGKKDNLCILEVKVASFDGVVFNYRGPEVYVFEKKEEEGREVYHPVPLAATDWLEKLRQHAWCSRHRRPRQPRCGHYDRCSNCQRVPSQQSCCEEAKTPFENCSCNHS